MPKPVGLRTEIIFHITLLLGAALLCGGLLLLKITERQLLNQRVDNVTATMEIAGHALSSSLSMQGGEEADAQVAAAQLLHLLPGAGSVQAWRLAGGRYALLYSSQAGESSEEAASLRPRLRFLTETEVSLSYAGPWFFRAKQEGSFLEIRVPLRSAGKFFGVLQARFSLADVSDRILESQRIMLLYVLLYGSVLFLFGLYLLNRNVLRPISGLMATTRRITGGNLEQKVPEQGPKEISSLARSFNSMVAALRKSRRDTEETINSLQLANEDLRRTRAELIRSEKMASVGHLAAGMAHEIGNPLGALVGYLELLRSELPEGRQREIAGCAAEEVGRIDLLVRDLLDYAAPGEARSETFDPAKVMEEALDLLANQGRFNRVRMVRENLASLPMVSMVRHQLLQVFVNLLLNACDASQEGGEIRVEGGVSGDSVWLSVIDEGEGISPDNLGHVFDPFFTTKAPGKGRGLGLSVCYSVVNQAGGTIDVNSEIGLGSRFTVRLPVA
jgi:two-component system NtrC family sensor kinase